MCNNSRKQSNQYQLLPRPILLTARRFGQFNSPKNTCQRLVLCNLISQTFKLHMQSLNYQYIWLGVEEPKQCDLNKVFLKKGESKNVSKNIFPDINHSSFT